MKNIWKIWAKALGEKASTDDHQADLVATVRSILIAQAVFTNIVAIITSGFIIAGVIRHW